MNQSFNTPGDEVSPAGPRQQLKADSAAAPETFCSCDQFGRSGKCCVVPPSWPQSVTTCGAGGVQMPPPCATASCARDGGGSDPCAGRPFVERFGVDTRPVGGHRERRAWAWLAANSARLPPNADGDPAAAVLRAAAAAVATVAA